MNGRFDLAVVGSGFAGSLMSMIARRLGLSVVLLERGRHPRFAIGESSTPLANLLLETIADRYNLPRVRSLSKWGTWQQHHAELACGLKRGFSFFHHTSGGSADPRSPHERQMLVAASPHDGIADTHWYRADLDAWLVREAQDMGTAFVDCLKLHSLSQEGSGWALRGERDGAELEFRARFVIDASGPGGFLPRALELETAPLPDFPRTSSLYAHFQNVDPFTAGESAAGYAPDDAALHHVFDGGWIWVLRFNNGVTSAGVAATRETADRFALAEGSDGWQRLLRTLPEVRQQFARAQTCTPFTWVPQLSSRVRQIAGLGWALLPSAAGFVDPLLSTGFPLTLLGMLRLADLLEKSFGSEAMAAGLKHYAETSEAELLATAQLVGALYRCMADFPLFRALTLLYFAAASYAETVRRLGRPQCARSFLLSDDPAFWPAASGILQRARTGLPAPERQALLTEIGRLVEAFDVAGLARHRADHCYPVRADDLYRAQGKLGVSAEEITTMLLRGGFFPAQTKSETPGGLSMGA